MPLVSQSFKKNHEIWCFDDDFYLIYLNSSYMKIYTFIELSKQNIEYLIFLILIRVESIVANAC